MEYYIAIKMIMLDLYVLTQKVTYSEYTVKWQRYILKQYTEYNYVCIHMHRLKPRLT